MSIIKSIFGSNSPEDHNKAYKEQGYNPNKRIKVYEDAEMVVSVPDGTPKEEIDAIVYTVKGKVKKVTE